MEAESLGNALRDLAYNVLKEIQRTSAKWIVKNLMNRLFGTYDVQANAPYTPILSSINMNIVNGFNSVVGALGNVSSFNNQQSLNPTTMTPQQKWLSEQNNLGAFSDPWENSPLNANARKPWESPDAFSTAKWDLLNSKLENTSNNLDLLGNTSFDFSKNLENSASSVNSLNSAKQSELVVTEQSTASKQMNTVATDESTQSKTRNTIKEQENTAATQQNTMAKNNNTMANGMTPPSFGFGGGMPTNMVNINQGSFSGMFGGLFGSLSNILNSVLSPVANIMQSIIDPLTKLLNSPVFTQLQSMTMGLVGSSGMQFAGSVFAISTLFSGDTKEKLLSMIFLELQLIYVVVNKISALMSYMNAFGGSATGMGGQPMAGTPMAGAPSFGLGGVPQGTTMTPQQSWAQNYFGLGAFSNPWASSPLNPNYMQMSSQNLFDPKQWSLLNENLTLSNDRFSLLNDTTDTFRFGLDTATQSVDFARTATESAAIAEQTSDMMEQVETTSTEQNAIAEQEAAASAQAAAQSLNQLASAAGGGLGGFADGGIVRLFAGGILKLARGGAVYHNSGLITGKGTSTSDSIPAMLSNGEAVLNAKAVKELGVGFISAVNNGNFSKIRANVPHFADGGYVDDAYQGTARGMEDFSKNVGAHVTTNNNLSIALVRDEREAINEWARSSSGGQKFLVDFLKGKGRVFQTFRG